MGSGFHLSELMKVSGFMLKKIVFLAWKKEIA